MLTSTAYTNSVVRIQTCRFRERWYLLGPACCIPPASTGNQSTVSRHLDPRTFVQSIADHGREQPSRDKLQIGQVLLSEINKLASANNQISAVMMRYKNATMLGSYPRQKHDLPQCGSLGEMWKAYCTGGILPE